VDERRWNRSSAGMGGDEIETGRVIWAGLEMKSAGTGENGVNSVAVQVSNA